MLLSQHRFWQYKGATPLPESALSSIVFQSDWHTHTHTHKYIYIYVYIYLYIYLRISPLMGKFCKTLSANLERALTPTASFRWHNYDEHAPIVLVHICISFVREELLKYFRRVFWCHLDINAHKSFTAKFHFGDQCCRIDTISLAWFRNYLHSRSQCVRVNQSHFILISLCPPLFSPPPHPHAIK